MSKRFYLILLLLTFVFNAETYSNSHKLVLDDDNSTIDGEALTSTAINGVSIYDGENIVHYEKKNMLVYQDMVILQMKLNGIQLMNVTKKN